MHVKMGGAVIDPASYVNIDTDKKQSCSVSVNYSEASPKVNIPTNMANPKEGY